MRGLGVTRAVTEFVPAWGVTLAALVTTLGDPGLLLIIATLVYWLGPRYGVLTHTDGVRLFAVTVTALAVVTVAKQFFGLPRPPSPGIAYEASGYGFPSGHATAATAVYAALAGLSRWSTRRRRWGVAAVIAAVVAASRIVLGVHYLVDVLVGGVVGAVVVVAVLALTRDDPVWGFVLAVVVAAVAVLLTGLEAAAVMTADAVLGLGGAVGAAGTWTAITVTERQLKPPSWPVLVVGIVVAGGPLLWVVVGSTSVLGTVVAAGVASVVGVGLPAVRTSGGTGRAPTR